MTRGRFFITVLAVSSLLAAACGSDSADDAPTSASDESTTSEQDETSPADGASTAPDDAPAETDDGTAPAGEPVAGGEITWGYLNDGEGFDTTAVLSQGSQQVAMALSEPLMTLDEDREPAPYLAESISSNEDFTIWTLELRPGITFHDGAPLDAAAVVANLEAVKASVELGSVFNLVAAFRVVDDLTVEIELTSPWAPMPVALTGILMASPESIGTNDTLIGVGPFKLESWVPGDSARIVRNPDYWRADEGLPYLDAVTFKFISDLQVSRQALEAGDLDGYTFPDYPDIVRFREDGEFPVLISRGDGPETLYLLNTQSPPLDDVRVRRALAAAIDREAFIDVFREGITPPASGPIDPSSPYYVDTGAAGYEPENAARMVEEWEAENGPLEFTLTTISSPIFVDEAEFLASYWEDAGAAVTIEEIGGSEPVERAVFDDFQVMFWTQFASSDPDGDYDFFHSSGGFLNWSNLVSADIDAGLDAARQSDDPNLRKAGYAQFQHALTDEMPMIWIDHLRDGEAVVIRPGVQGIADQILPDGQAGLGLCCGTLFTWEDVWTEP